MVPTQKYDVIHYIRETYLKPHNPSQYFAMTPSYLDSLPEGDTFGPAPRVIEPWVTMNYGSGLINTYEVGNEGTNFAYKGIATRLDPGPGGISRGRAWMVFDHDTFRMSAAWTGKGFIDWNGIHFNGRHQIHPRITGEVIAQNPNGPGWANPETGSFEDDQRIIGRDGKRYGPLPKSWANYRGLYHHGDKRIISYQIGQADVLEMPGEFEELTSSAEAGTARTTQANTPIVTRTFNIGPRNREMTLLVATSSLESPALKQVGGMVQYGAASDSQPLVKTREFDGASYAEVTNAEAFDMTGKDFTITARVKTKAGGTILAKTQPNSRWVPNGKTFFVRGGRLCYDIGWVGAAQSRQQVNDGKWHEVALRWQHENALAELFIDGQPAGQKELRPKDEVKQHVLRVGFTSPNFPGPQTFFEGELADVRFHQQALSDTQLKDPKQTQPLAHWKFDATATEEKIVDLGSQKHHGTWQTNGSPKAQDSIVAGVLQPTPGVKWETQGSKLCLKIPAGQKPLKFALWMT
ncbi:MAG: LamG domain-containing protein, partial [Planctomycetaceae bacterium]|nr:LamG domain-containing protein [Planctomycetaceae bacterium]